MHEPGKRLVVFFVPLSVSPQDIPILGTSGPRAKSGKNQGMEKERSPACVSMFLSAPKTSSKARTAFAFASEALCAFRVCPSRLGLYEGITRQILQKWNGMP